MSTTPTRRLDTAETIRLIDWIRANTEKIQANQWTYGKAAEVASAELGLPGLKAGHVSTVHKGLPNPFPWPTCRAGKPAMPDQAETIDKLRRGLAAIAAGKPMPEDVAQWLELRDPTRPLLAAC